MTSIFLQEAETVTSTTHTVKSWTEFYQKMLDGTKKHDMRNMKDREYKVNDIMILQEYDFAKGEYTGREAEFIITYITSSTTPCALSSAMLADNACILSLELVRILNG